MTKRLIRKDEISTFCYTGGYIARSEDTKYTPGEKVKAYHVDGTPFSIVGEECWIHAGNASNKDMNYRKEMWEYYKERCKHMARPFPTTTKEV